jgi:Tfp pilus assembly protein PilN
MAKIEINLLPRELRKRRPGISFDKSLNLVAGLAVVLVVAFVGVNVLQSMKLRALNNKIAEAQRRAEELRKNIELVDALTDVKDKVLQRISAIEALWVRVLEDLTRRVPDYLWLSLLQEAESQSVAVPDSGVDSTTVLSQPPSPAQKRVTMEGYSYSLNSLASFLIELIGSPYFKNMELQYVRRAELEERKTFTFQLVGDLYYVPDFEGLDADTAVHELASTYEIQDSEMNLAAGRE